MRINAFNPEKLLIIPDKKKKNTDFNANPMLKKDDELLKIIRKNGKSSVFESAENNENDTTFTRRVGKIEREK